jgi:hypothetical protein
MKGRKFKNASKGAVLRMVASGAVVLAALTSMASPAFASPATLAGLTDTRGAYYSLTPTKGLASASTTFRVPSITCINGENQGQDYGLDAWSNGGYDEVAVVTAICSGATPVYKFLVQADSASFTENGVGPGDLVVASFFQAPSFNQAIIHDLTSGYTWIADGSAGVATSVAIGTWSSYQYSDPGVPLPTDAQFGTVTFSKTQVNGDYFGFASPGAYNWVSGNTVLVHAGGLSAEGDTFKVVWKH